MIISQVENIIILSNNDYVSMVSNISIENKILKGRYKCDEIFKYMILNDFLSQKSHLKFVYLLKTYLVLGGIQK